MVIEADLGVLQSESAKFAKAGKVKLVQLEARHLRYQEGDKGKIGRS